MNTGFNNSTSVLYIKCKRNDLKWYQKLWNYITGHKDRNWSWIPVGNSIEGEDNENN